MKRGGPPSPFPAGGRPKAGSPRTTAAAAPDQPSAPPGGGRVTLPPNFVLVGEFGRAHGLKGEVRLKSFTADPLSIRGYSPLTGSNGRLYKVLSARQAAGDQPDMLVSRVEGVETREAAEALNRIALHVERDRLATDTEEDEFLLADLIGLKAEDEAGLPLGIVTGVPNFGGGDLLEIMPHGQRQTVLVPFTKACVPSLDIAGGKLVVTAPEMFAETTRPEVIVLDGDPDALPPGEAEPTA
jgi:16S rRNA processing protein RimM